MSDLISRTEALEITKRCLGDYATAFSEIRRLPAIDAEPVRHGHWNENVDCSICGMPAPTDDRIDFINIVELNYCPYCGAKMDEN